MLTHTPYIAKYGAHAETLNLKSEWPALGLADVAKNTKFPYDQTKKIAKADVKAWLDSFVAGKLEPSLKSEPIPESDDGAVKVVVGKNYKDIIGDKTKDVFVEFYAPWCGHCKKLAPIWKDLADSLVGKNIVIAKMDSTANDLPPDAGFAIQGFPTLKLFKAKTGQMIDYEAGDRSLESLVEFLQKNAEFGSEVAAVPKTDKKAAGKEGSEEKPAEEEPTEGDEEHDEL